MPTPFNHLLIAHELLASPLLAGPVREALAAAQPAFLLGNIAPDVQTISGQTREATHFFPVPIGDAPLAHVKLFAEYPALARAAQLPSAQAVFLAGYLAHLALDYLWVTEIFAPIFGPDQTWETFRERLYLHNVLRAHWDARDLTALPNSTAGLLRAAAPGRWLPFVTDPHLRTWRDRVAEQLSGGASRTVEVFAERLDADPQAFAALLASPDEMQRRVFARIPAERLDAFRALGLAHSAQIIHAYWEGRL
ncbi:MAG: zinc dependent phospholipase C family protein [Anaerolineales bacterium]